MEKKCIQKQQKFNKHVNEENKTFHINFRFQKVVTGENGEFPREC